MNQQPVRGSIDSIAYVEMYVGNIFNSRNFFLNALKFEHLASKQEGETFKHLMKQGDIYILLSSDLEKNTPISKHIDHYGDSVKKISFWVHDVKVCFDKAVNHGAKPIMFPQQKDGVFTASVEVFNQVEHEFLEINASSKIPGFQYTESSSKKETLLFNIDHIATCHPSDTIEKWVKFYKEAFGFSENKNEDIYSEESGMHIIIMKSPSGKVKLPLVEPSVEKSPLHTYLKYNHGPGVHHIAFETGDIVEAVAHYEKNFGELRKATPKYYDELRKLYPDQMNTINKASPHGVMLEHDDVGVLFQIFTKPVVTRPTFFLEFIQREKCEGFGTVNIKALYESLES